MSKTTNIQHDKGPRAIRHKPQLRADGAWALLQILEHGASSREVMPMIFERHGLAKDRAWLQESVFGVLRVLPTLQSWLRQLLKTPLKKQQKIIEHLIMLGLFQQAYMRTSTHAAVSETVEASKLLKQPQLSGMVNAILRNFERHELAQQIDTAPHVVANLPKWLYRELASAYPDHLANLCKAMSTKPPLWLRVNPLVNSLDEYCNRLNEASIAHEALPPHAIFLEKYTDVTTLPNFDEGGCSVQDLAAQQAASLLKLKDDDCVLDACAAPGGKTAALIETGVCLKALYALDNVASRNARTHDNLSRLGHIQRMGDKLHIVDADASDTASLSKLPMFNKILLDAPCSATGVIRRHPDIKWHRKGTDIAALVELQKSILEATWQRLLPGGVLLYATCSILPQENSQQIKNFLQTHSDASLVPIEAQSDPEALGWQILPGEKNMDGFFYARLLKSDSAIKQAHL
ncbi:16S rRNA (cytosine(967)-C(5))-methyltransferase RsmB [Glaciecola siphonariae]|uniref:16S rRNA (cytosine(967)-C(5))-methyltransferase n=1 Tax=Glaciecola siphonariae TaxID=521012 RepID=A0ABV9LTH6_9ALTE